MEYVVMAGGKGTRANCPEKYIQKVLLKDKNGKSLIENTLERQRLYAKESKVNLVTGFLHEQVVEEVRVYTGKYPEQRIELKYNPEYEKGILHSLNNAIKDIDDSIVILNGDTYYSEETFKILNEVAKSTLVVLPKTEEYQDCIKINSKEGKILEIGKEIDDFQYISIGCLFLEKSHVDIVKKILKELLEEETPRIKIWHGLINLLIEQGEEIEIKEINDHALYEVDTEEDYQQFLKKDEK